MFDFMWADRHPIDETWLDAHEQITVRDLVSAPFVAAAERMFEAPEGTDNPIVSHHNAHLRMQTIIHRRD